MKIKEFLLATMLLTMPAAGEIILSGGGIVAQVADGGGLQTVVTLVNLQDVSVPYILLFHSDSGTPLTLVTDAGTGSSFSGTLLPHASITISTAGVSLTNVQGWAEVQTNGVIGGTALYRVSVAPWIGAEATIPVDTNFSSRFALSFDQTTNAANGIAFVNPLAIAIPVTITVKDESGNPMFNPEIITLQPLNHQSFVLSARYAATNGRRGTVEISTTGSYMGVLALRFSGASIASILPLTSVLW